MRLIDADKVIECMKIYTTMRKMLLIVFGF